MIIYLHGSMREALILLDIVVSCVCKGNYRGMKLIIQSSGSMGRLCIYGSMNGDFALGKLEYQHTGLPWIICVLGGSSHWVCG